MDTLSVTTSDSHLINPAISLEYLATLISRQMTPPGVCPALPHEQIDAPLTVTDSKFDDDTHAQNIEALIDAIPPSPTPDFDDILSPPPTPSTNAIAETPPPTGSCPFNDYVLWGALVTSTPHIISKTNTNTNAMPTTHNSPSLSDSDISEIQIIPRRLGLDARSISPSTTSTSQDEDSLSSYSSPSAGSPLAKEKEKEIAHEYELLSSWLTELSIAAPVVDTQIEITLATNDEALAGLDLGYSPMNDEDRPNNTSDDAHEASHFIQDITMEIAEPIQHALAPKVSYSLLRHFEELDASFTMTPPKLSLSYNTTVSASPSTMPSPSLTKIFSNTSTSPSTRPSEKQTTTPKMLKFKRDLTRKTRKAKKGFLEFSWKMKNRLQEQYNVSFKTNGAAKAANGIRLAGCGGDLNFGCIGAGVGEAPFGFGFGFSPPALDWAFEVPAGYASAKGVIGCGGGVTVPLKASRSSAFLSLKSIQDITDVDLDLDDEFKAAKRISDSTTQGGKNSTSAIPATPSMQTMSSWSFSTDHEEECCQSPTCAGSGSGSEPILKVDLEIGDGIEMNHDLQSQSRTGPEGMSESAQLASSIANEARPNNVTVGLSTSIITDPHSSTDKATPCSFSIHPHISVSDNVSTSARCNSPASASHSIKTTDAAPHLKLDLEFEHEHEHDTTSMLHDGAAADSSFADDKAKGKGKEPESVFDNVSLITDYLGLCTFASTLTSPIPNPMLSESNVRLPGAYIFDDGELDASRSFSAALGKAYKALFEQASVGV